MPRNAKKEPEFAFARPQEQLPGMTISLRELKNQSHKFAILPSFQRKQVWPVRMKQGEVDSILRGDHITPPEYYQEFGEDSEVMYMLIDGHQRVSSILDFMDNKFKTWTPGQKRTTEPGSAPPIEPGKFFEELTPIARNYFLDYRLQFNQVRKQSAREMVNRFLRIQNHVPLSAAEKLNAYVSKAKDAARRIEQHAFWDELYEPAPRRNMIDRQEKFQSSLYLLAIEITPGGILDLQSGVLMHTLASGSRDSEITDEVVESVLARLDIVYHIFYGTRFSARAASIPMYQAVMFLEQAGYAFQQKDKGQLTPWMSVIVNESFRASGLPSYIQPVQRLTRESAQKAFWERHHKTVMARFGVDHIAALVTT